MPTFLSYSIEKRLTKHPEEFGKGAIEGVAGPEAANNASFSGTLVPLLTLGLPTSATAAIMLAAFQIFNLQPGPQLFENAAGAGVDADRVALRRQRDAAAAQPAADPALGQGARDPAAGLYAGILVFATLGVYSLSSSIVEVLLMYAIGVLGFFLRRFDFPIAPVILGVILGPLMETQFRRALIVSDGDLSALVSRPLSVVLLGLAAVAVLLPYLPTLLSRLRGRPATTGRLAFGDED